MSSEEPGIDWLCGIILRTDVEASRGKILNPMLPQQVAQQVQTQLCPECLHGNQIPVD